MTVHPHLLRGRLEAVSGLDLEAGLRTTDGRVDSLVRLLAKYTERHAHTGQAIREAWQAGDFALAHRLAHTVRGAAGFLGLAEIQVHAAELEAVLRPGCGPEAAAPIATFAERNAALCAALAAALESRAPEGQEV